MSDEILPKPLPFQVRSLLYFVDQIERLILEYCPKGRIRLSGLAWVDQVHERVRRKLRHTEPREEC